MWGQTVSLEPRPKIEACKVEGFALMSMVSFLTMMSMVSFLTMMSMVSFLTRS